MVAEVPRRPQGQPSAQTDVPRRRRGRPVDEATLATDQTVIDCAMAFVHLGLGSQRARDLARALVEGRSVPGRKLPRGGRKAAPGSRLVAYEMPLPLKSLEQRVARRLKRGEIQPRPKVVAQYLNLLPILALTVVGQTSIEPKFSPQFEFDKPPSA